jgi:RimJ/RimL family protein N-acetyltransferase
MWDGSMMTSVRPGAVPTLNAGPFSLRPFRHDDLSLVLAAGRDPFIPQITSLPAKATAGQARDWIALQHTRVRDGVGYPFVIAEGATDEPVGSIGLWQHKIGPGRASIGYWVLDAHRRRRVASCALSAIATWGFTLPDSRHALVTNYSEPGIVRLEFYIQPWNKGSWRTAEHAGFYREGLLRSWEPVGDKRRDMYMYSRLATDPT